MSQETREARRLWVNQLVRRSLRRALALAGSLWPRMAQHEGPRVRSNTSGSIQHGHVAAHSVALPGDLHQFADHRFLRGWVRTTTGL